MMQPNQLPDNLLSRFSRIYVSKNEFTSETGEKVNYQRFVLEFLVKDEPMTIELPIKRSGDITPKDLMLLQIADTRQEASNF